MGRFSHLEVEEKKTRDGKTEIKESIIFPRYHQLDAVRRLEAAARRDGVGKNYLVQHSAGSGKSNSIAWLAHRLSSLHDEQDQRVFDSVVVVTDRRVLDQQLQDNIYQFEHKQGVVEKIDENSQQLADALSSGTPIVITTLQKFPFVTEKIGELPSRRYALIVDEAHSSQTGEAARHMKEVLAARSLEDAEDQESDEGETSEDQLVKVMASRGRQKNLSFFAFTALAPKYSRKRSSVARSWTVTSAMVSRRSYWRSTVDRAHTATARSSAPFGQPVRLIPSSIAASCSACAP
ncbi:MAG TPA: DEAD/DEAH box helicase family protein [Polyangiaceae bacterium]|nr:DEAD/DEAH box helicase family protein [Polyangiaceae bacterium]